MSGSPPKKSVSKTFLSPELAMRKSMAAFAVSKLMNSRFA